MNYYVRIVQVTTKEDKKIHLPVIDLDIVADSVVEAPREAATALLKGNRTWDKKFISWLVDLKNGAPLTPTVRRPWKANVYAAVE